MSEQPTPIKPDIAGWWIVNHADPGNRHAVIDPCPVGDRNCHLDRQAVKRSEAQRAVSYTVDMLDGYGDEEPT